MEGVLTPEIWQHVCQRTGVNELNLTTRDVKDYRELMDRRIEICARHNITLADIQKLIAELKIEPGSRAFVDWARSRYQVIILSDTFYEFAGPFMEQLGNPTLFCHFITYDESTKRLSYSLRQEDQKRKAVQALKGLNFEIAAAGDSFNDVSMLEEAHRSAFFRAPNTIASLYPQRPAIHENAEHKNRLEKKQ
jgi:phosphoserine/homoserine phosphotransferase